MNYWSGVNAVGGITFNGTVTGLGMADFFTGNAVSFNAGTNYGMQLQQYYVGAYVQDSWKVNRRFTLNFGLRWEPYLANQNVKGQINHFDQALFDANFQSKIMLNAPKGLAFSGDQEYNCGKSYNCDSWAKFFPRVGFAWDPTGSGKMTIRAAYGMFGDRLHQFFPNQMSFGPPNGNRVNLANVNLSDPWANFAGGDPIPRLASYNPTLVNAAANAEFPTSGAYVRFNLDDYKPMYVHQWNFSVQRQVGNWLLTANYVGNSSIHLGTSAPGNPAKFLGLGPCTLQIANAAGVVTPTNFTTCSTTGNENQRRLLYLQNPSTGRFYAGIGEYDPGGTGGYNGLYLSGNKRMSHNMSILANYTWSHCISDIYDQQTGSNGVGPYGNRRGARSNCAGADQRQVFNSSVVAQMPKFKDLWINRLASNWQVAPIVTIRSAQQFSIVPGVDRALTTEPAQTVNLVDPNNVYAANQSVNQWLNTAAFAPQPFGTYGNLGRNNIKGPGSVQINLAVTRTFAVREGWTFQLRGESFNLPNRLNAATPVNSLAQNTFGQILSDISGNNGLNPGNQRIIQLAAKFVF
jgi:TonB dependent receptor